MDILENFYLQLSALQFPHIGITDIVEILIIAFFIYEILVLVQNTRTWFLLQGIGVLVAFFFLAALFRLNTILFIAEHALSVIVIAAIVVFQPELRKALEQLGTRSRWIFDLFGPRDIVSGRFSADMIEELINACFELGKTRTGALIVIEGRLPLEEYVGTGIRVDAVITSQLLINIFEHNTPLHDGAVIVKDDRIVSATCYLPLSKNMNIPKELGTRHRAAIGVSEVTDSLTLIVSEETGKVSVAEGGALKTNLTPESLREILQERYDSDEDKNEEGKSLLRPLLKALFNKRKEEE